MSQYRQTDFRALVAFAQRVMRATRTQRDAIVLSHGAFSPEVGGQIGPHTTRDFSPWSDMLLRWAENFMQTVTELSSVSTKRIVGLPITRETVTS